MSTSNSESQSESQELAKSGDEDENGHSYEGNGNSNENGTSASWRSSSRAAKSLLTLAFPISRVRRLVKSEADVQWVGVEAGFLIAKATVSVIVQSFSQVLVTLIHSRCDNGMFRYYKHMCPRLQLISVLSKAFCFLFLADCN